ncbi:hypothetical protein D0Z07_1293 [Hyphodiscus hymeniophilus]|uniref:Uncharacterized protein n=1 Tax=Hyphodiscus hymeniophilus TaxID=353542 RepID=A0A9P7B050_9HELO|nr:hypothetical protein D0Z07_1293 [Hyphodiscus hymeniophilus]
MGSSKDNNISELLDFESAPNTDALELTDSDFCKEIPEDFDFEDYLNENSGIGDPNYMLGFESQQLFANMQLQGDNGNAPNTPMVMSALNSGLETDTQISGLYSEDPTALEDQEQSVSNELDDEPTPPDSIPPVSPQEEFLWLRQKHVAHVSKREKRDRKEHRRLKKAAAKSTSNLANLANTSYEAAAPASTVDPSMITSSGFDYNFQPTANTLVSQDPSFLLSPLQPLDQFDLSSQQDPGQVSIDQGGTKDLVMGIGFDDAEALVNLNTMLEANSIPVTRPQNYAMPNSPSAGNFDDYFAHTGQSMHAADRAFRQPAYSNYHGYGQPAYPAYPTYAQPPAYPQYQPYGQTKYPQPVNPQPSRYLHAPSEYSQFSQPVFPQHQRHRLPMIPSLFTSPEPEINTEHQSKTTKASKGAKEDKKHKNARSENIKRFNPKRYYAPLPKSAVPRSWGSTNPDTHRPTFEYTETGELKPHFKFAQKQLLEYLENHPQPDGPLTLWIQICPADSNLLYPHKDFSHKCRFRDCVIKTNTIAVGEYRVAFDEHASNDLPLDPLQNSAGYVHLFCLEKFFDFPKLCKDYNVKADTRPFHNPKKFAINRDNDWCNMEKVVNDFIRDCQPWNNQRDYNSYYPQTLCYALTLEHLTKEQVARQRTREGRNGNSIDKHFNNLEVKQKNIDIRKRNKSLPLKVYQRPTIEGQEIKPHRASKRKSGHEDDGSEAISSESASPSKRTKTTEQGNAREPLSKRLRGLRRQSRRISGASASSKPTVAQRREAFQPIVSKNSSTNKRKYLGDDSSDSTSSQAKRPKTLNRATELRISVTKNPARRQSPRHHHSDGVAPSEASASNTGSGYEADGSSDGPLSPRMATRKTQKRNASEVWTDHDYAYTHPRHAKRNRRSLGDSWAEPADL